MGTEPQEPAQDTPGRSFDMALFLIVPLQPELGAARGLPTAGGGRSPPAPLGHRCWGDGHTAGRRRGPRTREAPGLGGRRTGGEGEAEGWAPGGQRRRDPQPSPCAAHIASDPVPRLPEVGGPGGPAPSPTPTRRLGEGSGPDLPMAHGRDPPADTLARPPARTAPGTQPPLPDEEPGPAAGRAAAREGPLRPQGPGRARGQPGGPGRGSEEGRRPGSREPRPRAARSGPPSEGWGPEPPWLARRRLHTRGRRASEPLAGRGAARRVARARGPQSPLSTAGGVPPRLPGRMSCRGGLGGPEGRGRLQACPRVRGLTPGCGQSCSE